MRLYLSPLLPEDTISSGSFTVDILHVWRTAVQFQPLLVQRSAYRPTVGIPLVGQCHVSGGCTIAPSPRSPVFSLGRRHIPV
jgi:hypothetical protein